MKCSALFCHASSSMIDDNIIDKLVIWCRCVPTASHSLFNSTRLKPLTREGSGGGECRLRTECIRFTPEEWTSFQKFRRQNGLTVTGLGLALFGVALMKYAYEGLNWPRTYLGGEQVILSPTTHFPFFLLPYPPPPPTILKLLSQFPNKFPLNSHNIKYGWNVEKSRDCRTF